LWLQLIPTMSEETEDSSCRVGEDVSDEGEEFRAKLRACAFCEKECIPDFVDPHRMVDKDLCRTCEPIYIRRKRESGQEYPSDRYTWEGYENASFISKPYDVDEY
jgi:hypothetical protein